MSSLLFGMAASCITGLSGGVLLIRYVDFRERLFWRDLDRDCPGLYRHYINEGLIPGIGPGRPKPHTKLEWMVDFLRYAGIPPDTSRPHP
jgi:hypothetical protein